MATDMDYWISEVCYNAQNTHINRVKLYKDGNIAPGNDQIWSRETVVNHLRNGTKISTMYKENGQWYAGARVKIVTIYGMPYIKTVNDSTAKDNLGNLKRFC